MFRFSSAQDRHQQRRGTGRDADVRSGCGYEAVVVGTNLPITPFILRQVVPRRGKSRPRYSKEPKKRSRPPRRNENREKHKPFRSFHSKLRCTFIFWYKAVFKSIFLFPGNETDASQEKTKIVHRSVVRALDKRALKLANTGSSGP